MATYFMFGNYSAAAMAKASPARTAEVSKLIKDLGGKVKSIHALLGDHDLVLIVDLPGETAAVKASVALGRMTGISFTTCAALPVDEFDKIISEL
ncbi:MAG: GYD domain-containing protein [Planctomycetes bacterium]|nr:GYD domain-containing protein [Planctomycetota bacterium]